MQLASARRKIMEVITEFPQSTPYWGKFAHAEILLTQGRIL